MSSAMVFERAATSQPGQQGFSQPQAAPAAGPNCCVVPRCEIRVEKTKNGCKLHCKCEDEIAAATLQQLCKMLAGQCCNCCCTFNGQTVCQVNLCCCHCTCEATADGCCITCETGDAACCKMTQCCCEAIACCIENGCCCTISFGNTPVCCCC